MVRNRRLRFVFGAASYFAASIALAVTAASADPQAEVNRDLVFSPSSDVVRHKNAQPERPSQRSNGKIVQSRRAPSVWAKFPKDFWQTDWSERQISPGLNSNAGASAGGVLSAAPAVGTTSQNDPTLFGRSNLQFRTAKNFQTPEPFRRTDCNEDECTDYSPFPKFKPSKTNPKTMRKPYLGLSITTPIQ